MDAALEQKLKRLMLLRVVMITTLLLVAVYVETVSEIAKSPGVSFGSVRLRVWKT